MADQTEIINNALRKIGASRISAITDGSKNANVALDVYDQVRLSLLRKHNWNFAVKRQKLAKSLTDPAFGFDYNYPVPSDFIRVISVHGSTSESSTVEYRIEGRNIATDADPCYLRYISDVTDANIMTPHFREAFSASLSQNFALSIAQSNSLYDRMMEEARDRLYEARSYDAVEDYPEQMPHGSWVTDRAL